MTINIKLDSDYSISADSFQWILLQNERPYRFYTQLQNLCSAYITLKSKASDIRDVAQLQNYENQLLERVIQAINTISQKDLVLQEAIIFVKRFYEPQDRAKLLNFLEKFGKETDLKSQGVRK